MGSMIKLEATLDRAIRKYRLIPPFRQDRKNLTVSSENPRWENFAARPLPRLLDDGRGFDFHGRRMLLVR